MIIAAPLTELVPVLQLSIGPVILISGVGLLLLTLTNRFGRMLDRARLIKREMDASPEGAQVGNLQAQIDILVTRARILRLSITLSSVTVLLVGILILVLFLSGLFKWEDGILIVVLFSLAILSLIGSIVAFIRDMNLALSAVWLEIGRDR
ncbi:MAG: DUF2721 domain-containing protein [Opitutaceae bacterium]|jgi:hypothetical protein